MALGASAHEYRRRTGGLWEVAERPAYAASELYSVRGGVAVVPVYGLIADAWWADSPARALVDCIDAARTDRGVHAAVLDFDSPGGEVGAMAEIVSALRRFGKPLAAMVNPMCASCAYWVASQCGRVYTTRTALVGCIGVYTIHADDSGRLDQLGVHEHVVSSGRLLGIADPGRPFTPDLHAMLRHEIQEAFELFVADVARGRSVSAAVVRRWANGSGTPTNAWYGPQAVKLGLADDVTDLSSVLSAMGRRDRA